MHHGRRFERVCRYMARPPIAEERLSVDGDGLVVYELKHPFLLRSSLETQQLSVV